MQFADTDLSWLLLSVLLLGLCSFVRLRLGLSSKNSWCDKSVLNQLRHLYPQLRRGSELSRILTSAVFILLVCVAALRPQWGYRWEESKRKGADLVIAVDVSESMRATDVTPNRLERARREILDLLEVLQGDRVALIAFAGVPFVEVPLTLDYGTLRLFLREIKPGLIPVAGTNISLALERAIQAFDIDETDADERGRAIVLLTDGEELEGDMSAFAGKLAEKGISLFIKGIGTTKGAPIPISDVAPESGNNSEVKGYKRDAAGNLVLTRLRPDILSTLAEQTGGVYVESVATTRDTDLIYRAGIRRDLARTELEGGRVKRWNEWFQAPLLLAIVLFAIFPSRVFPEKLLSTKTKSENLSLRSLVLALSSLALFGMFTPVQSFASEEPKAVLSEELAEEKYAAWKLYSQSRFDEAYGRYDQLISEDEQDHRLLSGKGASAYRLGNYDAAAMSYLRAAELAEKPPMKAASLYNAGNSLVQVEKYEHAIRLYEESLKLIPNDVQVKENLEYAKRLLEQSAQQQKPEKSEEQNNSEKQNEGSSPEDSGSKEQEKEQKQSSSEKQQSQSEKEKQAQGDAQKGEEQDKNEQQQRGSSSRQDGQDQPQVEQPKPAQHGEEESKKDETSETKQGTAGNKTQDSEGEKREINIQKIPLLDGLSEKRVQLRAFRERQAEQILRRKNLEAPRNDW